MNKKNFASKLLALMLLVLMALSLAACGGEDGGTGASGEPKNAPEAAKVYSDLMDQENTIFSENTALWEKVFRAADKGMAMLEDGKTTGISCSAPSNPSRTSLGQRSCSSFGARRKKSATLKTSSPPWRKNSPM